MSNNILNTVQGAAFFVDLEKLIDEETNIEKKRKVERKRRSTNTAMYIPLYDKTSSTLPNTNKTLPTENLSNTFTKEDFKNLQQKNETDANVCSELMAISPTVTKPFPMDSKSSPKVRPERKSSETIRSHSPRDDLIRVHSSPNIVKTRRKPGNLADMKNFINEQNQLLGNLRTNSDEIHSVWNKTYSRLPKLPKWVLKKHMSLDSTISPFSSPEPPDKEARKSLTDVTKHNIKIEEMFSQCQQKQDYSAANILPPINYFPNQKASNGPPLSKMKPITPTKKKQKRTTKASTKDNNCSKPKNLTKSINPKKGIKIVKPGIAAQKTQETKRVNKKTSKAKKKKVSSPMILEKEVDTHMHEENRFENLEAIPTHYSVTSQKEDENEDQNIFYSNHQEPSESLYYLQENISDGNIPVSLDATLSNDCDKTLDHFYDAVLAARPIHKMEVNKSLFLTDLDVDSVSDTPNLTKINIYQHNAMNSVTQDTDTYDISKSLEHSLSLDESLVPEQFALKQHLIKDVPQNHSSPKFLTRISEENNNLSLTTINSRTHTTHKSTLVSTTNEDHSNIFKEMSNLMFQPGAIPIISPSLKSVTLNQTCGSDSSLSSTLCSSDRPYLRSVLGITSRLSIYSSTTTGASDTSDASVLEWQKGKMIDKGAFGIVYQGLTSNAQLIAVKEVNIGQSKNTARNFKKLQDEINILKGLKHPNIIKFIGTSLEDGVVYIFMEFIAGGSLAGLISSFGALNESIYQRYTKQIMSAVVYLHGYGVVHRDIKGANILITVKGSIKLIDFGCAKELSLSLGSVVLLKSIKGTPYWMAPEVIQGTGCNHKSDIWSIGCTVMEMATGKPPWSEYPPHAAMYAVVNETNTTPALNIGQHSKEAVDFVQLCLQRDMNARPSAADLLTHPFVLAVT